MKNPQRSGPHKLKGGEIWNKLPISIKNSKSLEILKKKNVILIYETNFTIQPLERSKYYSYCKLPYTC